jgi:transcriptional regulator with XRE-family HTH domain
MPSKPPQGKLGKTMRKARLRKDWSQLDLAHKLGYKGDNAGAIVSRFERGHNKGMQTRCLVRFAKVLGVGVEELM